MPYQVAAFYQFTALPDFRELREPLRAIGARLALKGSVLLAHEGINGTVAGRAEAIDAFVAELQCGQLGRRRLRMCRRPAKTETDGMVWTTTQAHGRGA